MYISEASARARLKDNFDKFYNLSTRPADFSDDVANAEGEVNSYIGRRYKLPPAGDGLGTAAQIALDLLEALAWKRSGAGSTMPEKIKDAVDAARKKLADYSTGKAVLIGAEYADAPGGIGTPVAVVDGDAPMFTKDRLSELL